MARGRKNRECQIRARTNIALVLDGERPINVVNNV